MDPNGAPNLTVLIPVVAVAVVLLGVVIAVARAAMARRAGEAVDRWIRGAFSVWTGGEDSAAWAADRARASLKSWYGVEGGAAFWEVIKGLRQGQTGNVAWDLVRAVDILRIGLAAGYLDAEQCRAECAAIGAELQKRFRSWDELAQQFEAGMQSWQRGRGVTDPQETGRVQRNLPALRQTIWPAAPYDTSLALDD